MEDISVNLINNTDCKYIRIEIHILSLHWMMKNISYCNVSKKLFGLHRH